MMASPRFDRNRPDVLRILKPTPGPTKLSARITLPMRLLRMRSTSPSSSAGRSWSPVPPVAARPSWDMQSPETWAFRESRFFSAKSTSEARDLFYL